MTNYHYVYRIDFLEVPHIYFGSRTSKCLPELDTKYMGSPKTYKHYWEENTPVKTILITGFETREEAFVYEAELIRDQRRRNWDLSLNEHIPGEKFSSLGKSQSEESNRKRSKTQKGMTRDHLVKSFVGISPNGEHIPFTNATKFCRDNPEWKFSSHSKITECAKGLCPHYKGWRFFYKEDYDKINEYIEPAIPRNVRTFIGIDPNGNRHIFTNAKKFCEDNPEFGLRPQNISTCAKGKNSHHNNWKFSYADESESA